MVRTLANSLRPEELDDVIGQTHLLNKKNGILYKMWEKKYLNSLILFGRPGVGKTTLALIFAKSLNVKYQIFNAANDKKSTLDQIIKDAENHDRYILIVEEIHRMNRDRQDVLLHILEEGKITMIACTTENPYYVINPAIRSRATILELKPIEFEEMKIGIWKALTKNNIKLDISEKAIELISQFSNGDMRLAFNLIDILINLYSDQHIDESLIKDIIALPNLVNAHYGDEHHDLKSALQKSIRGSDVNAALHYFSRLIASGDYEALMRRMLIIAYEDIGLANPAIPLRVKNAVDTFREIGMPEGIIPLGLAIIEMSLSQKSNSAYLATKKAYDDVAKQGLIYEIPAHLRSSVSNQIKAKYKYPHDYPNSYIKQQYMPKELRDKKYYEPKYNSAYERKLIEIYKSFAK